MPGDEAMDDIEDEKGDQEGLGALAQQDEDRPVEQRAIDLLQRRLDRKRADLLLAAAIEMEEREGAALVRRALLAAGRHHQGIGAIGDLAHLDEADGRQAQDSLDLQLELP